MILARLASRASLDGESPVMTVIRRQKPRNGISCFLLPPFFDSRAENTKSYRHNSHLNADNISGWTVKIKKEGHRWPTRKQRLAAPAKNANLASPTTSWEKMPEKGALKGRIPRVANAADIIPVLFLRHGDFMTAMVLKNPGMCSLSSKGGRPEPTEWFMPSAFFMV